MNVNTSFNNEHELSSRVIGPEGINWLLTFESLKALAILRLEFALFSLIIVGCCSSPRAESETATLVGTIVVIGNEPFVHLALQTESGATYILECPVDVERTLASRQGQKVKIQGQLIRKKNEAEILKILEVQSLQK
jgi:hypothetical protein